MSVVESIPYVEAFMIICKGFSARMLGTYALLKDRLIPALAVLIARCVPGVEGLGFQVTDA